jgi:hypothetical protein
VRFNIFNMQTALSLWVISIFATGVFEMRSKIVFPSAYRFHKLFISEVYQSVVIFHYHMDRFNHIDTSFIQIFVVRYFVIVSSPHLSIVTLWVLFSAMLNIQDLHKLLDYFVRPYY